MTDRRPSAPGEILLPREVVLASAGTGKTYTISSRIIGLLAVGAPVDTLLASTFTRKAAGEILSRVLSRLAEAVMNPELANDLAREVRLSESPRALPAGEDFARIFRGLVRDLHRANVGTLDSLFVRIAGSFPGELGLPPDWSIADEPTAQRIEAEALQDVLSAAGPAEMIELVRMTMRGEAGRGVFRRLLSQLKELRGLLHQHRSVDPTELWRPPELRPDLVEQGGEGKQEWNEILRDLERAPVPTTAKGDPDQSFTRAVVGGVDQLTHGDWEGFCGKGLGAKVLAGESTYSRKLIPDETRRAVLRALSRVASVVRGDLIRQGNALRTLVEGFDGALDTLHRREGAYRFEDLTFLLAGDDPLAGRTDLWYRLDQKASHLLLDEFQDTSRAQWEALEPLASEVLSGHAEERSALVVADPKQSIYGWRGAEPALVGRVAARFGLNGQTLHRSYRSSHHVLDLVNDVFSDLEENPVWSLRPDLLGAVRDWSSAFSEHTAALDLPGHVTLEAGPREESASGSEKPALMAWAAMRIHELHTLNPEATMGVLVRRNAAVSRLVTYLRERGLEASEEGATTLTDSPAVAAFLALLRWADHPSDNLARYRVAHSPLGDVIGLSPTLEPRRVKPMARNVRRDLLTHGYGAVLSRWAEHLAAAGMVTPRELSRLQQLLELAFRWDARSTLRPGDFVRFVQNESMEAPASARIRVMTVHKAKGLEFDVVVLPELDLPLASGQGHHRAVLPMRDQATGEVLRIFPGVNRSLRPLFPEIADAGRQDREAELQDALGVLYVAMTRARHALHLLSAADRPDRDPKPVFSAVGVVRGGLGIHGVLAGVGNTLLERGDPNWGSRVQWPSREGAPTVDAASPAAHSRAADRATRPRTRFLPHRSPSALQGVDPAALRRVLSLPATHGRRVGTIVHSWLETLNWIEDWNPDPARLHALGSAHFPGISRSESDALREKLLAWLEPEEIRSRLSRANYPAGARVLTEESFAVKLDGVLYRGQIDRLVLIPADQGWDRADVLDYKTDDVRPDDRDSLTHAAAPYYSQIRVYEEAVARLFDLPPSQVGGGLVFLSAGRTVDVPPS